MASPVTVRIDGSRAVMRAHGGCAAFCGKVLMVAVVPAIAGLSGGFSNFGDMSVGAIVGSWGVALAVGGGGWWMVHTSRDHRVIVDREAGTFEIERRALAHVQRESFALGDVRWVLTEVSRQGKPFDKESSEWMRAVVVLVDDRVVALTPEYMRSPDLEASIGELQAFVRAASATGS